MKKRAGKSANVEPEALISGRSNKKVSLRLYLPEYSKAIRDSYGPYFCHKPALEYIAGWSLGMQLVSPLVSTCILIIVIEVESATQRVKLTDRRKEECI